MTQRQAQILAAIVKEYSRGGEPVASKELVERGYFSVSGPTIRNEMQVLEKAGFISQPHTSAGRVPTDQGYRYFVNKLMHHLELTALEQRRLKAELLSLQKQYVELGHGISKLLAEQTQGAAFALLPVSPKSRLESVSTSGLSQVVKQEDVSKEEIKELTRFFDELEDHGKALIKKDLKSVETFIGKEAPMHLSPDFSLVVTRVSLPSGQKGLIGIVGPKRMKYARNISLLEYISKLLSSGFGTYFILNF